MRKKYFLLMLCSFGLAVNAQDYVDIVKFSANTSTLENGLNSETNVNNLNFELYYPKEINENLVLITGITAENTNLNLQPFFERTSITMTRLNLGAKYKHNEKWSGTYVLLPKLASDFDALGSKDFQFGAIVVMDYTVSENFKYKFGAYSSTENFGITLTPIIGLWHKSKNKKLYINATLPIRMDVNYSVAEKVSLGADLLTSIKSYNVSFNQYVQEESIRFGFYAQYKMLDNSLLLRAKLGYDTTDYGLYNQGDTIGLQVLTFQVGGDDRNRINKEFLAAPYFGGDLIYRFDLSNRK